MDDRVMELHERGLTARQIADCVGRTRNAVIGHIWRYKKRGGPPPTPVPISDAEILAFHRGNLSETARKIGLSRRTLQRRGFKSYRAKVNRAKDLDTRSLIDAIDASGMPDSRIAWEVEMSNGTIYNWRYGRFSASPFLAQCVRTVLERQNTPGY